MKYLFLAGLLVLAGSCLVTAEDKTISLDGISRPGQIIGHLGVPLGKVVRVKGRVEILEGNTKKGDVEVIARFLEVSEIDGRNLPQPMKFEISPERFYRTRNGDVIDSLAYERVMTLGTPDDVPGRPIQARGRDLKFRLVCYLCLVPAGE